MAINGDSRKYRLAVPQMDTSVQKWLDSQINISISVRHLIRNDIQKNGYTDVTCRDIEQNTAADQPQQIPQTEPKKTPAKPTNVTKTQPQMMPELTPKPAPNMEPVLPQTEPINNTVPQQQEETPIDIMQTLSHNTHDTNDHVNEALASMLK